MERINIDDIYCIEDGIKDMDFQLFQKLKYSIEKRGQIRNILVCEKENNKYECLEGSKILKALKELNVSEVLAINMGVLSENDKALVRLENFRDYFTTNYVQVGVLIKKLSETIRVADICNSIPFDVRQAEHLITMTEFNWELFNQNKQIEGQVSLFDCFEEEEEDKQEI